MTLKGISIALIIALLATGFIATVAAAGVYSVHNKLYAQAAQ